MNRFEPSIFSLLIWSILTILTQIPDPWTKHRTLEPHFKINDKVHHGFHRHGFRFNRIICASFPNARVLDEIRKGFAQRHYKG